MKNLIAFNHGDFLAEVQFHLEPLAYSKRQDSPLFFESSTRCETLHHPVNSLDLRQFDTHGAAASLRIFRRCSRASNLLWNVDVRSLVHFRLGRRRTRPHFPKRKQRNHRIRKENFYRNYSRSLSIKIFFHRILNLSRHQSQVNPRWQVSPERDSKSKTCKVLTYCDLVGSRTAEAHFIWHWAIKIIDDSRYDKIYCLTHEPPLTVFPRISHSHEGKVPLDSLYH